MTEIELPENVEIRVDREPTDAEIDFARLLRTIESYSRRFRMARGAKERATGCALRVELDNGDTFKISSSREGHIVHDDTKGEIEVDFHVPEVVVRHTPLGGESAALDATSEDNQLLGTMANHLHIALQISLPNNTSDGEAQR